VPPPSNDELGAAGGKEDSPAEAPGPGWTGIGYGVEYQQVNTGTAIVIAYGGYTAHLSYSAGWASELVDAKLGGEGVGHIYAVQGPRDASYAAKEIGNSKLRAHLATLWPGIADVGTVRVTGTAAQAWLLLGWLRSRLGRPDIGLEHEEAARLKGVALDGSPVPLPPGDPPAPSDVLSDELERFTRDPVYEAAVLATSG